MKKPHRKAKNGQILNRNRVIEGRDSFWGYII